MTRRTADGTALIIQNATTEAPGHLGEALLDAGFAVEIVHAYKEPLPTHDADTADVVIALGGAQSAWDDQRWPYMATIAALLGARARAGRPTLGVCLGGQLLARGLGARVYRGPAPEIGLFPIRLTDAGRADPLIGPLDGKYVAQWHADAFDLPNGAEHLAKSQMYPQQAFRFGRCAWGVQFHPELDRAIRAQWLVEGANELAHVADRFLSPSLDEVHAAFAARFVELALEHCK